MDHLWQRLREARRRAGLTQADIAQAVGVSRAAVTMWESSNPDVRTTPTPENLILLARRLAVPTGWLMTGSADAPPLAVSDHVPRAWPQQPKDPRQEQNFWRGVEFTVCAERPEMADGFATQSTVDFVLGDIAIEFASATDASLSQVVESRLGRLLIAEKMAGRELRKHLLVRAPDPHLPEPLGSLAAQVGVRVQLITNMHDAARFITELRN